jgi:uncharacterized membrane protein YiaA
MRDGKLSLESSSTLYIIVVCVCVYIYIVYLTHREREKKREMYYVCVCLKCRCNNIIQKSRRGAERAEEQKIIKKNKKACMQNFSLKSTSS